MSDENTLNMPVEILFGIQVFKANSLKKCLGKLSADAHFYSQLRWYQCS